MLTYLTFFFLFPYHVTDVDNLHIWFKTESKETWPLYLLGGVILILHSNKTILHSLLIHFKTQYLHRYWSYQLPVRPMSKPNRPQFPIFNISQWAWVQKSLLFNFFFFNAASASNDGGQDGVNLSVLISRILDWDMYWLFWLEACGDHSYSTAKQNEAHRTPGSYRSYMIFQKWDTPATVLAHSCYILF